MDITGIFAADPVAGTTSTSEGELGRDSFMELLVAQLENQDPLSPSTNEDLIAQLAQFSSLEEMEELNDNIVGLAVLQQSNALMSQLTNSSALIDKSVQYLHPATNVETWGRVESVKIEDGEAVLRIGGQDVPLANVLEIGPAPSSDAE